ncbi:Glutathione-regulated potassium-efflux system protein KefB,putative [Moritella viscosa]|uniref:monovalent cation:proton antiporter family protein n=1 Tax=Moritella viscosa TaxID=80854 RepID=UPI000508E425|nr:monovalent cation:proton antiporter family protein [Moritella viscosa]CED58547.1 putative Na/H antiporter [Moritella viscosa]SHN96830.1 Glutathione-regulated potassium-efflux system protein KefB,putative [Moritella viscosa]SHO19502.1 Glutathione-regulated potassium-efflux system protein KefB,putative [Moritella viscosa]
MFIDIIQLLSLAVALVALFQRIHLPPILAYLATGMIAGPYGFQLIVEQADIELFAELGVVFLMFSLGLEFSLPRLLSMRHLVLGLGGGQVLSVGVLFMLLGLFASLYWSQAFVVASAMLMSSTAIVIKQLAESKLLNSRLSKLSISVLLFQDIAVVPFLIMIPLLAQQSGDVMLIAEQMGWAMVKGLFAVFLILSVGRWILPTLFKEIALIRSDELFVMSTLLVALIAGLMTHWLGLSMALGAFLAGMMLGEGPYRHQLEADIRPFRDVLMGLFFITIGMLLNLPSLFADWPRLIIVLVVMMLSKIFLVFILAKWLGESSSNALSTGLVLAQMGEFGFVLLALAGKLALLPLPLISTLVGVGVLSMAMTPWLIECHQGIVRRLLFQPKPKRKSGLSPPLPGQYIDHVIVCGYGRSGQTIARFLKIEGIPYTVIDRDPVRVQEALNGGEKIEFGDASRREIQMMLGVEKAKSIIITFNDTEKAIELLKVVKPLTDAKVLVRTTDDSNILTLHNAGATDVVPESLEGSLMMVSHVLAISGVPIKRILKRLQHERKGHYNHLHGFYFGGESNVSFEESEALERLHAIRLEFGAYAIGKTVAEVKLKEVSYRAVRRQGIELTQVHQDFIFEVGDVVLVCGPSRYVKRAEHCLLGGWAG